MKVIDSIICQDDKEGAKSDLLSKCPAPEETVSLILIYAMVSLGVDLLSTLRDIPF